MNIVTCILKLPSDLIINLNSFVNRSSKYFYVQTIRYSVHAMYMSTNNSFLLIVCRMACIIQIYAYASHLQLQGDDLFSESNY